MAEFSSPLSRENRLQLARSTFSSSAITGGRSLAISPLATAPVPQQDPETLRLLESNQNQLLSISSGIGVIKNSVDSVNQSLGYLLNTISINVSTDFNRESQKQQQERILAEDALRDETEALIERKADSSINNAVQPVAQKTTNTLNSLMGVFGSLFVGWLGTGGIQQIQSLAQESGDRFRGVKDIVGNSLRFIGDGLSNIKSGFDNIIGNITSVASNIKDAVIKGLIVAPFKAMFGGGKATTKAAAETTAEAGTKAGTKAAAETTAEAGTKVVGKAEGKGLSRLLPGVGAAVSGAFAYQNLKEGDIIGAGFDVGGMIPGPLGWASIGTGLAYETMTGGGIKGIPNLLGKPKEKNTQPQTQLKPQTQPKPQPQPKPQTQPQLQPQPQPQPKPQSQPQQTLKPPSNPQVSAQSSTQQPSQILTPEQIKTSEEKATEITPKANFNVNFGDQISNYTNKLFGKSQEQPTEEPSNVDKQIPDWMQSMKESPKSYQMPFDENQNIDVESQYKFPEISMASRRNIPKESTFGPIPEPPPNIIVAPMVSQQQPSSGPMKFTGSASDVPNISSSNPDNFYVMYSKSQYNVLA